MVNRPSGVEARRSEVETNGSRQRWARMARLQPGTSPMNVQNINKGSHVYNSLFNGTPCMPWPGSMSPYGYAGQIKIGGVRKYPHRLIYENVIGPIPDGLTLDHLCRNRPCVNPYHMEPVTIAVNVLRGDGPTARNSRMTHCKNGHELSGDNIYKWNLKNSLRICKVCRRKVNNRACERRRNKLRAMRAK